MNEHTDYPLILRPGQLRSLNEAVIRRLGTPVFFAAPEPARPRAQSAVGMLYEVVTGLYVVYRDHGMKLLKTYLEFCREQLDGYSGFVFPHYLSVQKLRGCLCHGMLPGGAHAFSLAREMDYYLPGGDKREWPGLLAELSEGQCREMVNRLSCDSDRLARFIEACAGQIASDEGLLRRWRETLVSTVFDKDVPLYGKPGQPDRYFDERIVWDLEKGLIGKQAARPHQLALRTWLTQLEPRLLHGEISDSDELSRSLAQALDDLYAQPAGRSSSDILLGDLEI